MNCYATPCYATACKATPCQWQEFAERDLTYLAAASIAASLLATQEETKLDEIADAAINMAEELRHAQYRLESARTEADLKRRIEKEDRHFRATASKATLELHDRVKQQFGVGSKAKTD